MHIFIINGGREVYYLARGFATGRHTVTVIHENQELCIELSRCCKVTAIVGDGSIPHTLEAAGIEDADAVIALSDRESDNLFIAQYCRELYGIERTIVTCNNPEHMPLFEAFGVEAVVSTSALISGLIGQTVVAKEVKNAFSLGGGAVTVVEVEMTAKHAVTGRALHSIKLPKDALIGCVVNGSEVLVPDGDYRVRAGDRLTMICASDSKEKALKVIRKEA